MARLSEARERIGAGTASILHADLDSFYASVEQRDDPRLRGLPVIVGGGVVLAASYEAKAFGVRSPMGGRAARALCPHAVVVPPRFDAYVEASRRVFSIFEDTTPLVEGISIDEAFLDVGGLGRVAGSPVAIARRLRSRVRDEVGLAITVGVARTKFLAKVASGVAKPDGLLEVPPAGELHFLHPLPVERLWGVGPVTSAKLRDRGIATVGDVARLSAGSVAAITGPAAGRQLFALSRNLDPRRVETGRRRRSIGSQQALGWRRRTDGELESTLAGLVDRVSRRLRAAERVGRTVVLRLRFDDLTQITRSHTLAEPTDETAVLHGALRGLLGAELPLLREVGCTLIGISVSNLDDAAAVQLSLPFRGVERRSLDEALDRVHARFGASAVGRSSLVGRGLHPEAPRLPTD
ncbi:MAG: DNA polymerase IV [Acidimicrobiales bacterium]